jgi:hypothetical protein
MENFRDVSVENVALASTGSTLTVSVKVKA